MFRKENKADMFTFISLKQGKHNVKNFLRRLTMNTSEPFFFYFFFPKALKRLDVK